MLNVEQLVEKNGRCPVCSGSVYITDGVPLEITTNMVNPIDSLEFLLLCEDGKDDVHHNAIVLSIDFNPFRLYPLADWSVQQARNAKDLLFPADCTIADKDCGRVRIAGWKQLVKCIHPLLSLNLERGLEMGSVYLQTELGRYTRHRRIAKQKLKQCAESVEIGV